MQSSEPGTNRGTPIKIEDLNQFVPLNTNPTDVLDKRNRVSWTIHNFYLHLTYHIFQKIDVQF